MTDKLGNPILEHLNSLRRIAFPGRSKSRWPEIARLATVCFLYVATAQLGLMYAVVGNTVTLVWPPSGIALAALLLYGYRLIPAIALSAWLANAWTEVPPLTAIGIALGNTLAASTGAFLLKRAARFHNALDRLRDVFALIGLAAIGSTAISASIGSAALSLGSTIPLTDYGSAWLKWWLGDMLGVLVVVPPLLVWFSSPRIVLSSSQGFEALGLVASVLVVGHLIFGAPELAGHAYYPAALAVFPFVIWGALRFEQWGATLITLVISVLAIGGTTHGTGPFAVALPVDSLVRWCAFAQFGGHDRPAAGGFQRRAPASAGGSRTLARPTGKTGQGAYPGAQKNERRAPQGNGRTQAPGDQADPGE